MATDDESRPETIDSQAAIRALIERIERHEDEGADIRLAADGLGLDAKRIKVIRKAKADAAAAQKTLEALFAGDLLPAGTTSRTLAASPAAAPRKARTSGAGK